MESKRIIKTKDFHDPREFLDALSPRSKLWHQDPNEWIFRGQRNAKWNLIPSAFRPDSWRQFEGLSSEVLQNQYYDNR